MGERRRIGEFELIARCFAPLARGEPGALGLTDDAAVLAMAPGERAVVTTDALVAGIHFPTGAEPADVASKALRVNLSDLAAMGARPRGYTLALALPEDFELSWVEAFARALGEDQSRFGISLIGGDTVKTPGPLSLTLTLLGVVDGGAFLSRSAACPGDMVWVSGTIGDAGLGLRLLQAAPGADEASARFLLERYHRPTPRLALGAALVGIAHAAADVSDGLIADLCHICEASGVDARLEADAIPLSEAARQALAAGLASADHLWSCGDDYELVFTAAEAATGEVEAAARRAATEVTVVGRIVGTGQGHVAVYGGDGREIALTARGHTHF